MKGLGSKLYTIFLVALFVISVQINVCAEEGWKRQLSFGYNQSNGNTDKSELNNSGEILWKNRIGGNNDEEAHSIIQTQNGNYIISGWSESNNGDLTGNHGMSDYFIVEIDNSGILQWQKCFGGSDDEKAFSVISTKLNEFILAGCSQSTDGNLTENLGKDDGWIVKINK